MKKLTQYLINNFDKIKIHSNQINKGDVFLALAGKKNHGNDFIEDAIKNEVKYIITDRKPDLKSYNENIIIVQNSLEFLKKISVEKRKLYNGKSLVLLEVLAKLVLRKTLNFF